MTSLITRALVSGTTAAALATVAAAVAGRLVTGSYAAPINATSHVAWGEEAAHQNALSIKYTGMGALLNYGGSIFWGLFYEGLMGKRHKPAYALLNGGIVSTAAYVTDYYLVPQRFTPGFEKRLPGKCLALIYGAFGAGLCMRDLLTQPVLKTRTVQAARRIRSTLSIQKKPTVH